MMNCQNCEKPAMFGIGPNGDTFLCLDCYAKLQATCERRQESLEHMHNHLAARTEMVTGLPGTVPRFPPRQPRVVLEGDMTLNNIRISNSSVGVLNTGNVGMIDNAVGVLKEAEPSVANAVRAVTEAIANDSELSKETKDRVLELLSIVASEGIAPKEKRRSQAMRTILVDIASLLGGSAALIELWRTLLPTIESLFLN